MKEEKVQFTNGLVAQIIPADLPSVTVMVLANIGSRHETKKINGSSHFIEHLMFKGTHRRKTAQILTQELDAMGAEYNAFTSKDMTAYYVRTSADNIEFACDILSDMVFNSTYIADEIERERGVIVEEINMYRDNPMIHVEDLLEQAVFYGHKLGMDIAGPRKVIETVSRKELISYRDSRYMPGNLTVVAAGGVDDNSLKVVQKYFGRGKKTKRAQDGAKFTSHQSAPRVELMTKDTDQVSVAMGFPTQSFGWKGMYAAQILATILGGNMSSRLFSTIREKHGMCYSISAGMELYRDTGVFMIRSGLVKEKAEKGIVLIQKELWKIVDKGVTKAEVLRAISYISGQQALKKENSSYWANWYGKQAVLNKSIKSPQEHLDMLKKVTAKDVQAAAKQIFNKKRINMGVIGPYESKIILEKLLG